MSSWQALLRLLGRRFARPGQNGFFRFSQVVAFGSVCTGSFALMLALAILEGFQRTLYEQALRFTWHVQVRTFQGYLFAYPPVVERLQAGFPGATVVAVREREALVRTPSAVEGVLVRALAAALDTLPFQFRLVQGRLHFASDTAAELLIGQALAQKLEVQLGDSLLLISATAKAGSVRPVLRRFRIVGIYRSGLLRYEELYVYIPFGTAAGLWGLPPQAATGVDMLLPRSEQIRSAPAQVERLLGFPFYGLSLYELHQPIFAWIELQRVPIPLVLGLMSLVAVFNVLTFLVLLVMEKTADFAILQALGMPLQLMRRFLLRQGVRLSAAAALTGCGLAAVVSWVQDHFGIIRLQGAFYYVDTLPVALLWWQPLLTVGVAVLLSVGASWLPARLLRRLPLTALLHFR